MLIYRKLHKGDVYVQKTIPKAASVVNVIAPLKTKEFDVF